MLGPYTYVVDRLEGEYAYLVRTDTRQETEPLMIALALLPQGVDVGTKLLWENLQYTIQ